MIYRRTAVFKAKSLRRCLTAVKWQDPIDKLTVARKGEKWCLSFWTPVGELSDDEKRRYSIARRF